MKSGTNVHKEHKLSLSYLRNSAGSRLCLSRLIPILNSHLYLGLPSYLFPSALQAKPFLCISFSRPTSMLYNQRYIFTRSESFEIEMLEKKVNKQQVL
jgi:hypothetical protein